MEDMYKLEVVVVVVVVEAKEVQEEITRKPDGSKRRERNYSGDHHRGSRSPGNT